MAKLGLGADPKVIADKPIRDLNLRSKKNINKIFFVISLSG